jgi:Domain of unknown function (DUF5122) beta-propeller
MKRIILLLGVAALTVVSLAQATPSAADLVAEQRTPWGLSTVGTSRTVANFSSLGWALEEMSGKVYTGGDFLNVTNGVATEPQPYLAAFATDTGVFQPDFRPQVGGPVLSLTAAPDGGLFVGGEMDTWNGREMGALVKINPATGELWPGWNTRVYGGTSVVRDVTLEPDGWLYVVGSFTTASDTGAPRTVANVVRMNPTTGAIDWTWLPQITNGGVWGVSRSRTNSSVYLAGWFAVSGKPAIGLDAVDATKVTWSSFTMNYPCCGHMYDVQATEFGTVLFAGEQHGLYVYDETKNMALKISHATNYDSRYQVSSTRRGGDYQELERVGDRIYATCHCWGSHSTTVGGAQPYAGDLSRAGGTHTGSVSAVVAYDARSGERVQSFNPYMAGDVGGWGVLGASDGCLWVTGGINAIGEVGSQQPARDLVRLCQPGGGAPAPVTQPEACRAAFKDGKVTVTWPAVVGVIDYVIYRSVDEGAPSWRGKVSGVSFTDTSRTGDLVYLVASRNAAGVRSTMTRCATEVLDVVIPLLPPELCTATVNGSSVDVAWAAGSGATDYVVYRSVDGGGASWRGRTAGLRFADTNRTGTLVYSVASKSAAGEITARTTCGSGSPDTPPVPEVTDPVPSCTVTPDPATNSALVSWPAAPEVNPDYVVSRSVDGGAVSWRGKVTALSFTDTMRKGTLEYSVEVKVGANRSTRTLCTPTVQGV